MWCKQRRKSKNKRKKLKNINRKYFLPGRCQIYVDIIVSYPHNSQQLFFQVEVELFFFSNDKSLFGKQTNKKVEHSWRVEGKKLATVYYCISFLQGETVLSVTFGYRYSSSPD